MTAQYAWQKESQKKWWVSIITVIILLIVTAVLSFIIYSKMDSIKETIDNTIDTNIIINSTNMKIWDTITITWSLNNNWDLINYTHTLITSEYPTIWLNSDKVNLLNYKWDVEVQGNISEFKNNIPIVRVEKIKIIETKTEPEINTWDTNTWNKINYGNFTYSMLWFKDEFYENYDIASTANQIAVNNTSGDNLMKISFFNCKTDWWSEDCKSNEEKFSNDSNQNITTSNWIVFDKLPEINSWFGHNGKVWYFINDVKKETIKELSSGLIWVNSRYIENKVKPEITAICELESITEYTLNKSDKILLKIIWLDIDWQTIDCEIEITPNSNNLVKKTIKEVEQEENQQEENQDNQEEEQIKEDTSNNLVLEELDFNVEQFPLKEEKAIEFSSRRWHTIVFPSPNIAYAEVNTEENFNQVWTYCGTAMNVIKYENKDDVETNPTIQIYECSIKNWFDNSDKSLILKEVWDKKFIIKINDSARYNFAKNLDIKIS